MTKRPTIKDIAIKADLSIATVHLALNDKPGVGEETRKKVKNIALELGYRPNHVAAGLKRKVLKVAVVLPVQTRSNRFFFSYQWNGIKDYFNGMRDFNIELIEVPYYDTQVVPGDVLHSVFENVKPDGLICTGFMDANGVNHLKRFEKEGIPVVLLSDDIENSKRICSVMTPYKIIGRVLAEQLFNQCKGQSGKFLIGAGISTLSSHYLVVEGFEEYINEREKDIDIIKVASAKDEESTEDSFVEMIGKEQFIGCCSVTSRDSVALAKALIRTNLAGKIPAIGSDIFPENIEFLKQGVFNNLIQKNPYQQGFLGARYLTEFLIQNQRPVDDIIWVGSEMVYRSSLPLYDNGFYRLIF